MTAESRPVVPDNSRYPLSIQRSRTRLSHRLYVLRTAWIASDLEFQVSFRLSDMMAKMGPWPVKISGEMTGSIRVNDVKRRGWSMERRTLVERISIRLDELGNFRNPQLSGSHTVSHAYNRLWHLVTEGIDHVQEVATMIHPRGFQKYQLSVRKEEMQNRTLTIISKRTFVAKTARTEIDNICDPD